jgi:SAM-dependent methyltransferase
MGTELSLAEVRNAQERHWTNVAAAWDRWFDWTDRNFAPLTGWLRDETRWRPGANVLDIGCGSGYPALTAAAGVSPGGTVTAIDISPAMIGVASRRAAEAGLDNVTFQQMDADALGFADETFDVVTCVCTLMFSPEPAHAINEIRRVLKPGGRFAIVVWDEPSLNPFSMLLVSEVTRFIELPPLPGAGAPGPFRFAAAGALESALRLVKLSGLRIDHRGMTFEFPTVDAYLQIVSEVAGWTRRLQALSADDVLRLRQSVALAVQPYCVNGVVRLGAMVHCAAGLK